MIGEIRKFKFWCQKVLPLVYDDSLSYYEVLCKLVNYLNNVIEDINSIPDYIDSKIAEALDDEHLKELIEEVVANIESAISSNNEHDNTNSSANYDIGQMLWWNGKLYKVIKQIDAGDTFIVDTNIELVNLEDLFNDFIDEVKHDITANDDGTSATATQSWTAGDWLWLDDVLYKVKTNITEGSAYVFSGDNANVEQITIETEMNKVATNIANETSARVDADNAMQLEIDALLNRKRIFYNIEAMKDQEDLSVGDVVITCYPYMAKWQIIDGVDADYINILLDNGNSAHLLNNGAINVGAIANLSDYDDISAIISFLISNNYKDIIIPKGIYKCNITLTANCKLRGAGKYLTSLYPSAPNTSIITVNGDNIFISDLKLQDDIQRNSNGITVGSNGCNNSRFENLHIENCVNGFISFYSLIWDEFINCDFIGNFSQGFTMQGSSGTFFNNNTIESCKFNNNVNSGIIIDCQADKCFGNNFIACNVEYNAIDRFNISTTASFAVYITGANAFIGCYFEGNTQSLTGAAVKGVGLQLFSGCSFINEKYLINKEYFATVTTIFTLIGCKQYGTFSGIATPDDNSKSIIIIGCNFHAPNTSSGGMYDIDINKPMRKTVSDGIIDGNYQLNVIRANVTSITNVVSSQILYLVNDLAADYTIASSLMASGTAYTISKRSGAVMMVNWTGTAFVLIPLHA